MQAVTAACIPGLKLALKYSTKYEDRQWFSFLIKVAERDALLTPAQRIANFAERLKTDPVAAKKFFDSIQPQQREPSPFDGGQRYYPDE